MALNFPQEHLGNPMIFSIEARNPYENLSTALGAEDQDSSVRAMSEQAQVAIDRLLSMTIISDPDKLPSNFMEKLAERFSPSDMFFLVDENGQHISLGGIDFLNKTNGVLELLGNFNIDQINSKLAIAKNRAIIGADMHRAEFALLDLQDASKIIEIGAGSDYDRIAILDQYARQRGGRLICQEQVPAAAHEANKHLQNIPYLPIPTRRELLVPTISELGTSKIFTLQNVISSMSLGGLEEFLAAASLSGAQKISITQSLGIANNSNIFPQGLRPGETSWGRFVMQEFMQHPASSQACGNQNIFVMIAGQAELTARLIMMELLRKHIQNPNRGSDLFKSNRTTLLEQSRILEGAEIAQYLSAFNETFIQSFQDDKFNTIHVTPFSSIQTTKNSKVAQGTLCVMSSEFVLEVSKKFTPIQKDSKSDIEYTSITSS